MPRFLADWHSAQSIHLSNLGNDRNLIVLVHHPPPPMYVYQQSHIVRDVEQLLPRARPDLVGRNDVRSWELAPHVDHCFRFNLASPTLWPFNAIRWSILYYTPSNRRSIVYCKKINVSLMQPLQLPQLRQLYQWRCDSQKKSTHSNISDQWPITQHLLYVFCQKTCWSCLCRFLCFLP